MGTVHTFKILRGGEADSEAFVFENSSGLRELVTTVNGEEHRLTLPELEAKIKETEESLAGLKKAKNLLENT